MDKYTVQHWNGEKWCNDRLRVNYEQAKEYAQQHKKWADEHWGPTPLCKNLCAHNINSFTFKSLCRLCRRNELIYTRNRGNIHTTKGKTLENGGQRHDKI